MVSPISRTCTGIHALSLRKRLVENVDIRGSRCSRSIDEIESFPTVVESFLSVEYINRCRIVKGSIGIH